MVIEERIPLLEDILGQWKKEIGVDFQAYKNHVYRMVHFCLAMHPVDEEGREKIITAGCFHDLGIWTSHTLDYLPPSILLAKEYLTQRGLASWFGEIELMIDMHHKFRKYEDNNYPLVDVFRRGDLVDVSLGWVTSGVPEDYIKNVKAVFPNSGFHKRLLQLAVGWFFRHPLNPAPMMKW
jgi:hypothetical protein